MRCPIDGETLVIADRGGVEIDYCPKCRGVWLDRGELDKIIERAAGAEPVQAAPLREPPRQDAAPIYHPEPPRSAYREEPRRRYGDDEEDYRPKKKRRESFLSDLFDF